MLAGEARLEVGGGPAGDADDGGLSWQAGVEREVWLPPLYGED